MGKAKKQSGDDVQDENAEESNEATITVSPDKIDIDSLEKITNVEQAIALVRKKYKVPAGTRTVHVTEDKQVFYVTNPARVYASQKNVKLFSISSEWD